MQLMWLSSPMGTMHAVSITKRKVVLALAGAATLFVVAGMVLYFVGFRVAVQVRPELVRAVGGVMTASDVAQRDAEHRTRLEQLQQELAAAEQQLKQLQALKDSFMQMALPKGQAAPATPAETKPNGKMGMGGPRRNVVFNEPYQPGDPAAAMNETFDAAQDKFRRLNDSLSKLQGEWQKQLMWLEYLPTGIPIEGKPQFASRFGFRLDPFTRLPARHEGIDFNAPVGTPILATASGTVVRALHDPQYGKMVDIDHGNGYMTRYAHAETLGYVGQTGMATGPHLHYEFHINGVQHDPMRVVLPEAVPITRQLRAQFDEKALPLVHQLQLMQNVTLARLD